MSAEAVLTEHRVRVPLRGGEVREATLLHGPAGWGECSPLAGYACDPALARRAAQEAATVPWPTPVRDGVKVNALVPALPPEAAAEVRRPEPDPRPLDVYRVAEK